MHYFWLKKTFYLEESTITELLSYSNKVKNIDIYCWPKIVVEEIGIRKKIWITCRRTKG